MFGIVLRKASKLPVILGGRFAVRLMSLLCGIKQAKKYLLSIHAKLYHRREG
jgi:hypothetical protein